MAHTVSWTDRGRIQIEGGLRRNWRVEVKALSVDSYFKRIHSMGRREREAEEEVIEPKEESCLFPS